MNKKWLVAVLAGALSLPSLASELKVIKEIDLHVLNGKEVDSPLFKNKDVLELEAGTNQILFSLDQLVIDDGRRSKLKFTPVVMRFDATESPLQLSYPVFKHVDDAKAFRKTLDFVLTDTKGAPVDYQAELLHVSGLGIFPEYARTLEEYNMVGDGVAVVDPTMVDDLAVKPQKTAQATKTTVAEATGNAAASKVAIMQTGFAELSAEEQQQFMQWAMRNLK
ncbi:DUF2057 domain-containing protein [Photobacterium sanctipauli]|uniref:DUF2057 domain-containing protein n=1 Tax=Photobacterium sanctipauli TaxID=1342794 RepID=A0A2T3NTG4_9GAMM|nr:DUF2057 domain-containing protein [Photobacterium sanctipauli]PSW19573.1 DUF2057 domain-containing protein [Photobacterium sanctipauli]